MINTLAALAAIVGYILATYIPVRQIVHRKISARWTALAPIFLHAYVLYRLIDIQHMQNLAFVNLFSLVAWLVAVLVFLASFRSSLANLIFIAYPIAAFSLFLPLLFPGTYLVDTAGDIHQLLHILLSTIAFSVLCMSALQAFLVGLQEWMLRHKQSSLLIQILPPLELMETVLFQLITVGFILLTIVIISSVISFYPILHELIWQKMALTLFAWIVFVILLSGRWFFGWRGQLAIRSTIVGVLLITLVYFGSVLF